jgi:benzoate-CoA ligase family protein
VGTSPLEAIALLEERLGNVVDYLFEKRLGPGQAERPYLTSPAGDASYADLHAMTCRVGHMLREAGVGVGDRVLFSVTDGLEFAAIFLGAMKIGAVSVPINTYLKPEDYAYYVRESGAKVLIFDESLAEVAIGVADATPAVRRVFVVGGAGDLAFEDAIAHHPPTLSSVPREAGDMAFWLFSSGTTGAPKAVVHTHAHLFWATELFGVGTIRIGPDDVILCPPKMFFAFGLGAQVYFPARTGARVIADRNPPRPETILAHLMQHEPTILVGVPTLYASLLKLMRDHDPEAVRRACRRLRLCISGGEVLPPALARSWLETTGVELLDGVGTTEMTHMFLINRPGRAVPNSCGRLVDGYQARIVDDDWVDVAEGEIGNLFVAGPTAAREYWNNPDKSRAVMRDGGVLTGDKFYRDAEGNYFYVGRKDDMLRVGGIWVSPAEIEKALADHEAVEECAVVGCPDENGMIKPKAFVVARAQTPAALADLPEAIRSFMRERLAHYKCPRWVELVPSLPKTATGKIQRFRLAQPAAAATFPDDRTKDSPYE